MKRKRYKIELTEEAESDFDNSYEYYAEEDVKLADKFFLQVNQSLQTIADNPQGFQNAFKNIRQSVIRKFPFIVYFRVEKLTIQVIAIFHTSRDPEIWKQRTE